MYLDFLNYYIFDTFDNVIIKFLNDKGYFISPDEDNYMTFDNFLDCELSEDYDLTDN
jgi:hypothetical protein